MTDAEPVWEESDTVIKQAHCVLVGLFGSDDFVLRVLLLEVGCVPTLHCDHGVIGSG